MSRAIAMIILRKFSACDSARLLKLIWPILVTPSTSVAISLPNIDSTCVERGERVLDGVVQQAGRRRSARRGGDRRSGSATSSGWTR